MTTLKSKALLIPTFLLLLSPMALPTYAASSAPVTGDWAASFNAGFANPFDDDFDDVEPVLTGTVEYYTSPRVSWRGLLGVMSFSSDGEGNPSIDATFVNANVAYNWERGKFHPYVTGGIGLYDKDPSTNLPDDFDETKFGANGGGGLEWFLGQRWAIKFEGTLHRMTGENPNSVFLGTAGVKFWF